MTKIVTSLLCISLTMQLIAKEAATPLPESDRVSELAEKIQYGLDTLLTSLNNTNTSSEKSVADTNKVKGGSSHVFHFTDQDVVISDTIEFKKISITAETQSVEVAMVGNEETNEGVTLIGLPHHQPKFTLHANNSFPIFVDVFVDTEFRRLPRHNLKIRKDYSNTFNDFVQWTLFNNQRLLFSPVGFKSSGLELPEDPTNHLIQGEFVDTNLILNGICLIDGIVFIVADTQDVTIHLKEVSWLMNATDAYQCALILITNFGRKITFKVDEAMEWRSHLNTQFYVIQAGPGKVEVKIVADDND